MIIKVLLIVGLVLILFSLMSGLFFLVKDKGKTNRVAKSLTWRIGLSIALFIFIIVAYYLGWLQPEA